jgi:multidrug efflux pump subunit AcrB
MKRGEKAVHYLLPAMIGSSLSTIVIFIPFELMTGVAGAYFKVMTNTMIITLICSFFVTWIFLPVIYLIFSACAESKVTHKKVHERTRLKSKRWVSFFLRRPAISLVLVALLCIGIWLILPKLETGFLPEMDEGSIVLDYTSPPGTSLEETDRMLRQWKRSL